jgi:membrane glycosyltransferase
MGNISVESDSMRSLERYSIRVMLLLMTLSAVYAAVTVMAGQGVAWASIVSAVIAFMAIPFGLYAIAFLIVFPFGSLNEFVAKQTELPDSPFASDRLPDQQIQPADENLRAY